jgi:hypothetical protein
VVEASPVALRLTTRTPFSTRAVEIPSDSIEDLTVAQPIRAGTPGSPLRRSGRRIVAGSDEKVIAFGDHLDEEERQWICDVLRQVLTA